MIFWVQVVIKILSLIFAYKFFLISLEVGPRTDIFYYILTTEFVFNDLFSF